ncbi:MAG TPA: non-homologous end-joining DNA ligase [Symbiobacteriaceae bacterium]|nr:non-homologous end-joining DNA ligase [Symbiobacteriaceae bacterium]
MQIEIESKQVAISNPDKVLWPEAGVTKREYIEYLIDVAPQLVPYTRNRLLMIWRYPDGVGTKRIEEKLVPDHAPDWIARSFYKDRDWVLLNDAATLVWLANWGALELHVPFDRVDAPGYPTELVFDLDPPEGAPFELVREVALALKEVLDGLSLSSVAKTSGATGLQIHVPIEPLYPYEETRRINEFVARYLQERLKAQITLERSVANRGQKLYFDYLQLWKMRTMPAPYSLRATPQATAATPVTWDEVARGFHPTDFTIQTVRERLTAVGDQFSPVTTDKDAYRQSLNQILGFLQAHENSAYQQDRPGP